jgi:hypothetical protein
MWSTVDERVSLYRNYVRATLVMTRDRLWDLLSILLSILSRFLESGRSLSIFLSIPLFLYTDKSCMDTDTGFIYGRVRPSHWHTRARPRPRDRDRLRDLLSVCF